jgi:hypothetical protein
MGAYSGKVRTYEKPEFLVKNLENPLSNFFLEHMPHHLSCSICGKNFNSIGLTVFEIQKWSKKMGVPVRIFGINPENLNVFLNAPKPILVDFRDNVFFRV